MNHLLDDEENDHRAGHARDREITLGTTTVLGIFFGLAILCAAFFGFGYSLGSKHVTAGATPTGEPLQAHIFGGTKPAAGSNPYAPVQPANAVAPGTTANPSSGPAPKAVAPPAGAAATPEAFETVESVVKPPRTPPAQAVVTASAPLVTAPAPVPLAAPVAAQQLVVQVAALSHQEDADLIRTTLERRGYSVAIRADPNDKLLHVQVGPFGTRKDAEAMRQKLLSDGFNAYIK
jgi:cell division septation protein DedD